MAKLWNTVRDPVRLGVQTAVGGVLAYLICQWLGLGETSWAVISALFVAHQNMDATAAAAAGRTIGALLGTLVGLATVLAFGGSDLTLLRIAIAAVVLNAVAALRPDYRFGVVAAVIIALEPDPDVLGGAVERAAAILVGSVAGAAGAFLIWPESAARRTMRPIRAAIDACRTLVSTELDILTGQEDARLAPIQRRFLDNIRVARDMSESVRLHRTTDNIPVSELVDAVSRLWHTLLILDRLRKRQGSAVEAQSTPAKHLQRVREQVCAFLMPPDSPGATADAGTARAAIASAIEATGEVREEGAVALVFALRELDCDLAKLEELFRRRADAR